MQIEHNNLNFSSRNKTIRFADDIARKVNTCYPMLSTTKFDGFKGINLFKHGLVSTDNKITNNVRAEKDYLFDNADNLISKIIAFVKPVKKYKAGNCGECAQIASIIAKVNGIKNCHLVNIFDQKGNDSYHTVLFVNDTKPYIIDAWLGFADYADNALKKYETLYKYLKRLDSRNGLTYTTNIDDEFTICLKDNFPHKQTNKILKIYPEMRIYH